VHSFNEEEKHDIVKKFIKHASVQNYLPPYARRGKEGESKCAVLEAMRGVYVQITANRNTQNLTFKSSVVVCYCVYKCWHKPNAHCQDHKGFSILCPKSYGEMNAC